MRFIAAILLVASAVIHLLLGALGVVSAKFHEMKAHDDVGDLSSVSSDLAPPDERAREHAAATAKVGKVGTRELALAIAVLTSALLQLVSVGLLLLRRARRTTLVLVALSIGAIGSKLAYERSAIVIIAGVLLLAALGSSLLTRPRPRAPQTRAPQTT